MVIVNGCFDIVHAGHLYLFNYAKQIALKNNTKLMLLLNSDISMKLNDKVPIMTENERYNWFSEYGKFDEIRLFNEKTPIRALSNLMVTYIIKGIEYKDKSFVEKTYYSNKIIYVDNFYTISTSMIKERIRLEEAKNDS